MVNGPEGPPRLDLDAVDWDWVGWRAAEREVRRLRQRIFKAAQEGDLAKVRSLQKLMLRSRSNTLLSVRQVTQRNAGRKTAGIDGEVALTSESRADVAVRVHQEHPNLETPGGQARVYSEGIKPCKIEAARNSGDFGQVPSSTGPQCTGARVGGPVRAKILWLPAGPQLPGRNRRYLCVVSRAPGSAAVGS